MAFQLSPGVNVSEIDLTTIVPAVGTTEGAYAGRFSWGPMDEIISVSSERDLARIFGKPDANTFIDFFSCANFLAYARNLRIVRSGNTALWKNATSGTETVNIKNRDDYELNYLDLSAGANVGMFAAKYAGELGNSIKVSYWSSSNTTAFSSWAYAEEFPTVTGTSDYTSTRGGLNDEIHIIVIDEKAKFSPVANTVLEKFSYLSVASDATNDDGSSKYYVDVLNDQSEYIYVMNHPEPEYGVTSNSSVISITINSSGSGYSNGYVSFEGGLGTDANASVIVDANGVITSVVVNSGGYDYDISDTVTANVAPLGGTDASLTVVLRGAQSPNNWGSTAANTTFSGANATGSVITLTGGADATVTDADRIAGYDKFANPEEVDVSLVVAGNASTTLISSIKTLVETRKDCVGFVSPDREDCLNNADGEVTDIVAKRNSIGSSSYLVMDSGWGYQFDKYNNVYRWVPLNGHIAGLCVRTDFERDPWFSPAGFNRGQLRNVIKLAWYPTKSERDDLYKNGINPVNSFPGEGIVLFGDKTLLAKPSAFDRINVRRLFIVLEKAIARAAKYSLFEFNDAFTRAQFVALVEPYLRDVQGRRGIFDFRVVCDETNNTGEVIDRNEFVGDIYIKPARSINFIQLNFVAVRTGVAFEEVVGRF